VVCLLLLAGAGLYFKLFTISWSSTEMQTPDVHLSIDK
jgi:hypothetical protein